jgi:hypothetical protein
MLSVEEGDLHLAKVVLAKLAGQPLEAHHQSRIRRPQ